MQMLESSELQKNIQDETDVYNDGYYPLSGYLHYLINTGSSLPSYWSRERDVAMRTELIKNGFLASVVNVILLKLSGLPFRVQSVDSAVGAHLKLAELYNAILQNSLNYVLEPFIMDVICTDNGGFLYIQGTEASDQPLSSVPIGLKHLDSTRIQRTGNSDYPVVYHNIDNNYYKIHESRIINVTQMPSADIEMFGVGYCFISRAVLLAQHLLDVANYEAEGLGSRSSEEIIYGSSIKSEEIKKAFTTADLDSDNAGLNKVGKRVYLGLRDAQGKLGKISLKSTPEYFNKRDDIEITLTLLALASGGQSTWFYDAVKSGSTKASAQEATKMGESKLINWWLKKLTIELETKFCPDTLRIVAGLADDDFDGTKSRIRLNAAQTRKLNLETKVSNIRIERELQYEKGEITATQFENLELADGRLSNGLPINTIFQTDEANLRKLLYFIPNPLDFKTNVYEEIEDKLQAAIFVAQGAALNGKTILTQGYGRKAMYALLWLQQQYLSNATQPFTDTLEIIDQTAPLENYSTAPINDHSHSADILPEDNTNV